MADFVSDFWGYFIIATSVGGIIGCFLLIRWMNIERPPADAEVKTMGHVWDEDLEEYNNPLPGWWLNMFYITLIFGLGYLVLYPGAGAFKGLLGWTSLGQYESELERADATYGPLFDRYKGMSLTALGSEPEALKMGERLYNSYCTQCHGADAGGVTGFPNLRDNDWLWGGTPEAIQASILDGRVGNMPAWKVPLGGDQGVSEVVAHVLSLSDRNHDQALAAEGAKKYGMFCAGCHGAEGKGNTMLGAPNLADSTWLYGGSPRAITKSIAEGRMGRMPAHREFLGEAKAHLLSAYIYNLSGER